MTSQSRRRDQAVRDEGGELWDVIARLGQRARRLALRGIDSQKRAIAGNVDGVALALRQTGANLRERDRTEIGQYADDVAEQVEKVSNYLRRTSTEDLIRQAGDVTRRQPLIVAGGSFAAAFLAARFLKSSAEGGSGEGSVAADGGTAEARAAQAVPVATATSVETPVADSPGPLTDALSAAEADADGEGLEGNRIEAGTVDGATDDSATVATDETPAASSVFVDAPRSRRTTTARAGGAG